MEEALDEIYRGKSNVAVKAKELLDVDGIEIDDNPLGG